MSNKKVEKPAKPSIINVMIDLETLGTSPGCVILSIGATIFDVATSVLLRTDLDAMFYGSISIDSSEKAGLKIEQATVDWWHAQQPDSVADAFGGVANIKDILDDFSNYLGLLDSYGTVRVWGNAASFDLKILEAAYKILDIKVPWKYRNEMCYRTLKNLFPQVPTEKFDGIKHNALHDAIYQGYHAEKILDYMREN